MRISGTFSDVKAEFVDKSMPYSDSGYNQGNWLYDEANQCPGKPVKVNDEMKEMKRKWAEEHEQK